MQGISSLKTFEKFLLYHPIFGLYNQDSKMSLESGCEFCFVVIVASNRPSNQNIPVVLKGTFQYELSRVLESAASGARERRSQNCEREGERRSEKK